MAKVTPGSNHGWPQTMRQNAIFVWEYCQAPTAMAFMQDGQFPAEYHDQLFVALFGNAYAKGRNIKGKKIVKMKIDPGTFGAATYDEFVTYVGEGAASPCGLAFGPGGLYFSDLHGDDNGLAGVPSGSIYRIRSRKKKATATWKGAILADTKHYEIVESYVYFPAQSVKWEYFTRADTPPTRSWKGEAIHYNVAVEGEAVNNGAWSHPEPAEAAKRIKGYVAFAYGEIHVRTERGE
jgi:uncharacterized protein (DUF427 family)